MKAEFNGIVLEGTPDEIAAVLKTLELTEQVRTIIKEIPVYPYLPMLPPVYPAPYPPSLPYPPYPPNWITSSSTTSTGQDRPADKTTPDPSPKPSYTTPTTTAG